jgi:hypothetical protein
VTTPQGAPPPYWIATAELWIRGPGGNVRAHQPGDRVSNTRVVKYGWQAGVRDPGAAIADENGPELASLTGAETVLPATVRPAPAKTTPPATTSDSGPAAEGTATT